RADLPRHPPAGHERARGLRAAAERSEIRRDEDRDADRGGAGIGHRPQPRRRRESLFDQAVLADAPALARRERGAARRRMATRVNAAPGDDLTVAYRRLNAAYQQTLRYARTCGASISRCSAPSISHCSGWPTRSRRRTRTRGATPSG